MNFSIGDALRYLNWALLPVILLTSNSAGLVAGRTLSAGVVAVIEKPFMDQPLADAIERAFARNRVP